MYSRYLDNDLCYLVPIVFGMLVLFKPSIVHAFNSKHISFVHGKIGRHGSVARKFKSALIDIQPLQRNDCGLAFSSVAAPLRPLVRFFEWNSKFVSGNKYETFEALRSYF